MTKSGRHTFITGITILLLAAQAILADSRQTISLMDANLYVSGARYINRQADCISFMRHQDSLFSLPRETLGFNPEKAKTTTGVIVLFKTASSQICLTFELGLGVNRGSEFGVFENGEFVRSFIFAAENKQMKLEISSSTSGSPSVFEIALPSWSNPALVEMQTDVGCELLQIKPDSEKIYVAYGNSVTHGTGQGSASFSTYPFLVSRSFRYQLFNIAIGGGKLSLPVANMLGDFARIDLMTILMGYNDWQSGQTPEQFKIQYRGFLTKVRENHSDARIVCISPLHTRKTVSDKSGTPIHGFRSAIYEVAQEFREMGDHKIFFIAGDQITSEENLKKGSPDPVHLSVSGAKLFAAQLTNAIRGLYSNDDILHTETDIASRPIDASPDSTFHWPGNASAAIALTYDDALDSHLDVVAPQLAAHGFPATFYITGQSASLAARLPEWKTLAEKGHELGNHTLFHPCDGRERDWVLPEYDLTGYSSRQIANELSVMNTFLQALDGRTQRTFAYPCGDFQAGDSTFRKEVSLLFAGARGVDKRLTSPSDVDSFMLPGFGVAGKTSKEMIAYVKSVQKSGSVAILLFHGVGGDYLSMAAEEHAALLFFLNQNRELFWIDTVVNIADHIKLEQKRMNREIAAPDKKGEKNSYGLN